MGTDQAGPEALWEDGRVWLESLAVNPLVYLVIPVEVQFVEVSWSAGGSKRFRLALLEGVCIAELMNSELRLVLSKWEGT